jgi:hypothetical protein
MQSLIAWTDEVASVDFNDDIRITLEDGSVHSHRHDDAGWQITLLVGTARVESTRADRHRPAGYRAATDERGRRAGVVVHRPLTVALGEALPTL